MSANKILIADDDRVVHESLSIYLKAEGYEVVDAYNGAEALEKLDAEILANATNSAKLNELMKEKEDTEAALEEKMDRWVYLTELAEQKEAEKNK